MCKKANAEAQNLGDRTKGLDSRGNVGINARAESTWAVETLSFLDMADDDDAKALCKAMRDDLERIYQGTINAGVIDKKMASKFHKGYVKLFGPQGALEPSGKEMISLMLESEYDFKSAVDALNRIQETQNQQLYNDCRGKQEFTDRGRKEGIKRRNSFVNPHAGITDRDFRTTDTEDFFPKEVVHAKGMLEGKPSSNTYQTFANQGAPFIGGVSGTMQGLAMGWELEKPLKDFKAGKEQDDERERREKTAAIHMATLLAGGHHSVTELLFSAQSYGLFSDVTKPLDNYPKAMKELGDRFKKLGLPCDLSPKAGAAWTAAINEVEKNLEALAKAIAETYESQGISDAVVDAFKTATGRKGDELMSLKGGLHGLANELDTIAGMVEDDEQEVKKDAMEAIREKIEAAQQKLAGNIFKDLDANPFLPVQVEKILADALGAAYGLVRQ